MKPANAVRKHRLFQEFFSERRFGVNNLPTHDDAKKYLERMGRWFSGSAKQSKFMALLVLYAYQNGECYYCKNRAELLEYGSLSQKYNRATIEHLNDSNTGRRSDKIWNLVMACYRCNNERCHRHNKEKQQRKIQSVRDNRHIYLASISSRLTT